MSRKHVLVVVVAVVIVAVFVATNLVTASEHRVVVSNKSGQMIERISIHPSTGSKSFEVTQLPDGHHFDFTFRQWLFDGRLNVAAGELEDGTRLLSAIFEIEGDTYRGSTRITVQAGGNIQVVHD